MHPRHAAAAILVLAWCAPAQAQSGDADLAQELTNPLADLVTVPIQMSFDRRIGPADDGTRLTTNVQPVIPFEGKGDWNLISRTIVPVVYQNEVFPGAGSQFGLGDVNLTLFLSPKRPAAGGLIWGAGPTFLIPTATDSLLGGKKWGAGPAAVGLVMRGPWTVGMLANHIWSFAGNDERQDYGQQHLPATVPGLHLAQRVDGIGAIGGQLQLEVRNLVGARQRRR